MRSSHPARRRASLARARFPLFRQRQPDRLPRSKDHKGAAITSLGPVLPVNNTVILGNCSSSADPSASVSHEPDPTQRRTLVEIRCDEGLGSCARSTPRRPRRRSFGAPPTPQSRVRDGCDEIDLARPLGEANDAGRRGDVDFARSDGDPSARRAQCGRSTTA